MNVDRAGRDEMNAVIDREFDKAERLLDEGANPNSVDNASWSALHFAAQNNDTEMVRMLLKHGALTSLRDRNGNSPLSRAVASYRGEAECISALLEAGADPDNENDYGVSARSLAFTIANYDTRKFFE
jgi:ankyrin repeat protein